MPKGAIMRPEEYKISHLKKIFSIEKVLTLESVRGLLANPSKRTAIRKLNIMGCRASYSHAGKYYTIDEYARYDKYGYSALINQSLFTKINQADYPHYNQSVSIVKDIFMQRSVHF